VSIRKLLAAASAGSLAIAAALFVLQAAPVAAQEVVQDEGAAYRAWYEANQAKDIPKALAAAKAYLAKYASGQYAASIDQWLTPVEYDLALKEKRLDDAIKSGRKLLKGDVDSLLVMYQLAFSIWSTELIASPPKYDHLADAVEFCTKAMPLIESGKAPGGATSFDKNVALAWMNQALAIDAGKAGKTDEAVALYGKSTALAPDNVALATRNLYAVYGYRQSAYAEAVKAFKALPEADQQAPDANPEAKAALEKVNAEADGLVDSAAAFVSFATAKGVAASVRDRVNETMESVYKSRHPEDAALDGLKKILQEKGAPAPAPGA
jgi:tetratricopeptide (TPR) repeat protein